MLWREMLQVLSCSAQTGHLLVLILFKYTFTDKIKWFMCPWFSLDRSWVFLANSLWELCARSAAIFSRSADLHHILVCLPCVPVTSPCHWHVASIPLEPSPHKTLSYEPVAPLLMIHSLFSAICLVLEQVWCTHFTWRLTLQPILILSRQHQWN